MPEETRSRNNTFSLSGVVFTEIPTCPMLEYPHDWQGDGVWLLPLDGFGDQDLATEGVWASSARAIGDVTITTMDNAGATAGEWAQYEYRGYGFKLSMMRGPAFGLVDIYLDGVVLATVDLYSAVACGPEAVYEKEDVPLSFHRVKVVITGNKNVDATAAGASWHALQVIP